MSCGREWEGSASVGWSRNGNDCKWAAAAGKGSPGHYSTIIYNIVYLYDSVRLSVTNVVRVTVVLVQAVWSAREGIRSTHSPGIAWDATGRVRCDS